MKYLPLIWAGLWRKPARTILTLLSVVVAFTLFGLTTGLNAAFAYAVNQVPANRISVLGRFGGPLPLSERDQIARIEGVTKIGYYGAIGGYYRDPKNSAFAVMIDPEMQYVWPELSSLTPQQFAALQTNRTGVFMSRRFADKYGFKTGDTYPLLATGPNNVKADGSKLWTFNILGIVADVSWFPTGYVMGNFDYLNEARVQKASGTVGEYLVLVKDPARTAETGQAIDGMFANSGAPTTSMPAKLEMQSIRDSFIDIGFVTDTIAGAGLFMILIIVGNSFAQSVRERIPELAVMKVLGFSNAGVMAIQVFEAVLPCLLGAAIGVALAAVLAPEATLLLPAGAAGVVTLPRISLSVFAWAMALAVVVAFVGAVIPLLRFKWIDVAAALSGR